MSKFFKFLIVLFIILGGGILSFNIWAKTDSAKTKITSFLEKIITEELGVEAKISDLSISLPLIASAKNITFFEADKKESISIKNLAVNILPSLFSFWEITIWSASAEELKVTQIPNFQTNDIEGIFQPSVIIKSIHIEKIILDKNLTGKKNEIVFNLSSYFKFDHPEKKLYFTIENHLTSPQINENSLEILGTYDVKKNKLDLNYLELQSNFATIKGNLLLDESTDKLTGDFQYTSNIIGEFIEKNANSTLTGSIKLSGTYKEHHIETDGNLEVNLSENDYFQFLPISWKSDFTIIDNSARGNIQIVQQDGLDFSGDLEYKNNKIYLQNFKGSGQDFESTIDLSLNTENLLLSGEGKIKAETLQALKNSLPFLKESDGAFNLNLNFSSPDNKNQHLHIKGKLAGLDTTFAGCDLVNLDLISDDLWSAKISPSTINLYTLNINDLIVRSIVLNINSEEKDIKIDSAITAQYHYPIHLNFTSLLLRKPENFSMIIKNLSGNLGNNILQITKDIKFDLNNFELENLHIGEGAINASGAISDSSIKTHIDIHNIDMRIIPMNLPYNLRKAKLQGELEINGTPSKPELISNLNITNITKTNSKDRLTLNLETSIKNDSTKISSKILHKEKNLTELETTLPSKFSISPFIYEIVKNKNFSANLKSEQNSDLLSIIPMPLNNILTGDLDGELTANGTLNSPKVSGKLNIKNGAYSYKMHGISLKNINGEFKANGAELICDQLSINDNYKNNLKASAKLSLNQNNPFTIKTYTDKFNLINTPYLQGVISGHLNINGDINSAISKGEFVLGPMEIKIPEHFQEDIPELNIVDARKSKRIEKAPEENSYKMNFDINLKTSNNLYIRGWGVDTQLKGNLRITGDTNEPLINGILRSVHGRYQEFGKSLIVKEGVLTFDGPISPSPYLNIVGAAKVGTNEIRLVLSGSIQDPDVSIESTPSMSQDEALSMLLFGEHPENISTFQALQLADGARRLSGHGGGFDPLGTGRKILGVDEINFNRNEEDPEKSSVGLGKHLSDKVYFEVEQGRQEGSSKVKIEVQLTPKISVETTAAQKGSNSCGINWKFDY
jgi:autotransporter translocation and assembly factor TamB